jgi:hypothetical protein
MIKASEAKQFHANNIKTTIDPIVSFLAFFGTQMTQI